MEVTFDNKSDVLNANILTQHDGSVVYTLSTEQSLFGGRTVTVLRDTNPLLAGPSPTLGAGGGLGTLGRGANALGGGAGGKPPSKVGTVVGTINWKKKIFDVGGSRRTLSEVRRKPVGWKALKDRSRYWKWGEGREEWCVVFGDEGWVVHSTASPSTEPDATLHVPYRPHLFFGKQKPVRLEMSPRALQNPKDEVFLILVLVYCEVKRQEGMNSAGGW